MHRPKPVLLAIVSGFGVTHALDRNAVRQANMPVFRELVETYPAMTLKASGAFVGLGEEDAGTAEAGHRTIGAGRVVYDPVPRISADIATGAFFRQSALRNAFAHAHAQGGAVHLITPVSGDVKRDYVEALLAFAKQAGAERVFVHAIIEDADPAALLSLERAITRAGIGALASVSGSSWAMDGGGHWDRIQKAYEAMALGHSDETFRNAEDMAEDMCVRSLSGDAFPPAVISPTGHAQAVMSRGDACIFAHVQPAPIRALVTAFTLPSFEAFERRPLGGLRVVTLVEVDKDLPADVAYPFQEFESCIGEAVSAAGLKQLRIAETEGYAHITNFFNGMRDSAFPGEERIIIPSPNVSRYEQVPDMSMAAVASRAVKEIALGAYDAIMLNLAAPDLVAHSGDEAAAIKACEAADKAIGRITDAVLAVGGAMLLVSDHGHAEVVRDPTSDLAARTGTRNPVPFLAVGKAFEGIKAPSGDVVGGDLALTVPAGTLADVAPTMLKILGVPAPREMTGRSLI